MAEWKKVVVSGSNISQLNNDENYVINGQSGVYLTGSFTGSFAGDGSGLTGVIANNAFSLSQGEGIVPFSYNGASAVTVAVSGAAQLSDNAVTKWNDTDGKFVNSNITDNGSVININSATTITGSVNITGSDITFNTDVFQVKNTSGVVILDVYDQGFIGADGNGSASIDTENRTLLDATNGTNSVNWANRQLIKSDGTTVTVDWENGTFTGSFTGSFTGDGSGLTGIATFLNVSGSDGNGITIDLKTEDLTIAGTANEIETTASGNTITIGLPSDVTISNDLNVQGDLTVQGTASFQNTQNLLVADRFVLFASGSNTTGDGGIVVQQGTQNVGELFGYDSTATRWGFTSSFDAASSGFNPIVYVGAVQTGTGQTAASAAPIYGGATYGLGTIHIDTDDSEIWIYA